MNHKVKHSRVFCGWFTYLTSMKPSVIIQAIISDCFVLHSIHVDAFYIVIKGRFLAGISYIFLSSVFSFFPLHHCLCPYSIYLVV